MSLTRDEFASAKIAAALSVALADATRCCLTCINWPENNPNELCQLYTARPPAHVIAYGCPAYMDKNDIPY